MGDGAADSTAAARAPAGLAAGEPDAAGLEDGGFCSVVICAAVLLGVVLGGVALGGVVSGAAAEAACPTAS